jgi:hypothetical protein
LIVYATAAGQLKLSDGGTNPDVQMPFTAAQLNLFQTVTTGWTKCSKTLTVTFTAAPSLSVLEIDYFGPP